MENSDILKNTSESAREGNAGGRQEATTSGNGAVSQEAAVTDNGAVSQEAAVPANGEVSQEAAVPANGEVSQEAAVPANSAVSQETASPKVPETTGKSYRKKKKKIPKKWLVIGGICLFVILVIALILIKKSSDSRKAAETKEAARTRAEVTRGDISNNMTSTGSLAPKDTYTITSLVSGEILRADFEEGDEVTAGQTLYVIDSTEVQSNIVTAEKNLEYAREDYNDAEEDYKKAEEKLRDLQVCSTQNGYVRNLTLKPGDNVQQGGEVAELYNDSLMKLRLPFLSNEADALSAGQSVSVILCDTGEELLGRIASKASLKETLSGGVVVKYVIINVSNPGGLSENDRALARVGEIVSAADACFEAGVSERLRADVPSGVRVDKILVSEGQKVAEGTPLFSVTQESAQDALKSSRKSLSQAESSLENAADRLKTLQEQSEEYTIKAPIDGRVIYKNAKAGDKISTGGSSAATLAMIYDLSALTFEMSIDELDISKISTGLDVEVTADAFENQMYYGKVTNVSLNGTYSNGVTTYPVVVTLLDKGSLLPGMNVSGTIILEKSEDTLLIPSEALNRGNIVYVETASIPEGADVKKVENTNAPEGYTAVRVSTGLTSDDQVEILGGLSEGMVVYAKNSSSGSGFNFGGPGSMPGLTINGGGPGGGGFGGGSGGFGGSGGSGSRSNGSGGSSGGRSSGGGR